MNTEDLIRFYTTALYRIPSLDIHLVVDNHNDELDEILIKYQTKSLSLITAANPYSQELPEGENTLRNKELKSELDKKWKLLDAISLDPKSSDWEEKGFVVFGITLIDALCLAGTYGQHAILYYEKEKKVELIFTGAEIKSNDGWKDVLRDIK